MTIFKPDNHTVLGAHSENQMNDSDTPWAFLKILVAWVCAGVAKASTVVFNLTLAEWVQVVALIFTLVQLFFLLRDKWWRDPKRKRRKLDAQYDRSVAEAD